jgi:hypothetical protein
MYYCEHCSFTHDDMKQNDFLAPDNHEIELRSTKDTVRITLPNGDLIAINGNGEMTKNGEYFVAYIP